MLDTIILQILIAYSEIIDPDQFKPSARIIESVSGFFRCVNNPLAKDKKKGIYKPKLTIIKRGYKIYLKIEFSVPKLLFGNNLDEAEEKDFEEVVEKLQKIIEEMGVSLWPRQIRNAEVVGFHLSKNILLSKGYTANFSISELSKVNISEKYDIESIKFRNGGQSLQLYSNVHSLVIYDKINDLSKPAKRAIDKDQTKKQLEIFEQIKEQKLRIEVLRIEARISKRKKLNEIFEILGQNKNPIFSDIFKKDICQKIIKWYWNKYFGKGLFLFNVNNNPQKILQMILMRYPKTNIKTAIMMVGLNSLCKDEEGIRGFRNIAKNYRPKTNWIILSNYLRKFEDEIFTKPTYGFIKNIENSLEDFKPFKLSL